MILGTIGVLVAISAIVSAVALAIAAWRVRDTYNGGKRDWVMTGLAAGGAVLSLVVGLAVVGMISGEINLGSPVADGCYRISSTTSSGVGVGVNPKGGVTVVPITTSGHTYTPIACPS